MLALTHAKAFRPSEAILREPAMPLEFFERACAALEGSPYLLARDPVQGRQLALQHCRQYRNKRWHRLPQTVAKVIPLTKQVNLRLAKWCQAQSQQDEPMPTLTIDNIDYDLDSLSANAQAQLQGIQFVDQELARLQAHTAALQNGPQCCLRQRVKGGLASGRHQPKRVLSMPLQSVFESRRQAVETKRCVCAFAPFLP